MQEDLIETTNPAEENAVDESSRFLTEEELEAEEYASWCDYPVYTHSSETYMGEPVDVVEVSLDYDLEDDDDE